MFQDVSPVLADTAVLSSISHGLTSFKGPCLAAILDAEAYKSRCAYVRAVNDQAVLYAIQNMTLHGTGQEWIAGDIETGHSPQLAASEQSSSIIIELAEQFV